jgi:ubiquinone/menaquinone biosynthesis C-methylase UbiE
MEEARRLELQMRALSSEIEAEVRILRVRSGMRVFDAGCGTGGFSRRIARLVSPASIHGADSDPLFIAEARRRAKKEGVANISFMVGDISKTDFEDSTFDLAYCRLVLPHLHDKKATIQELKRITRNGGRIASVDEGGAFWYPPMPKFEGLFGKIAAWRKSTRGVTEEMVARPTDALALFQDSGLHKVKVHPIPVFGTQKDPEKLRQLAEVPAKMLQIHRKAAIDGGFMTEQEYVAGVKEYATWLSRPDSFWMVLSLLTIGRVEK